MPSIEPFWHRIPRLFAYGFHWRVLVLAVGLAVINNYLLSGLFVIVLYAITTRYAMAVLEHTARGELAPPPLNGDTLIQGYELPLKLFFILLIYGFGLAWVATSVGPVTAMLLYVLGSLLFPALIMMLVLSESLQVAINPFGWVSLARAIGWPYLALFGMWLAIGAAQDNASALLLSWLPERLMLPFWLMFNTVFSAIAFHMMGYVLLQYHEEIGDPLAAGAQLSERSSRKGLRTPLFDRLLAEGKTHAAAIELLDQVEQHPEDLNWRRRAHQFLLSHHQVDLLAKNARPLIDAQIAAGLLAQAAETFVDCARREVACEPLQPTHYLPLIRQLRRLGFPAHAVRLAQGFRKRYAGSEDAMAVLIELASTLSEDLNRDDKARQVLDYALAHYAHDPGIVEARTLRDVLGRMTAGNA